MSQKSEDETLLWKDRKRILGMPISFTVYTLRNARLYLREGFFNTKENEMLLYPGAFSETDDFQDGR